ncbi:hypothetical protein HPB50_000124 [Hyalomma asiaticum]|uniref:Uncharacterized protein n=1 Tax=Hyalomma asiaticum TaxID=266040 RepID=A0ACB7TAG4_HYAAI|nr:hypothetical protein HPB50_000124 [Hyalomma asiaticum]
MQLLAHFGGHILRVGGGGRGGTRFLLPAVRDYQDPGGSAEESGRKPGGRGNAVLMNESQEARGEPGDTKVMATSKTKHKNTSIEKREKAGIFGKACEQEGRQKIGPGIENERRVFVFGDGDAFRMKRATLRMVGWNQNVQFRTQANATMGEVAAAVDATLEVWEAAEAVVVIHAGSGDVKNKDSSQEEAIYNYEEDQDGHAGGQGRQRRTKHQGRRRRRGPRKKKPNPMEERIGFLNMQSGRTEQRYDDQTDRITKYQRVFLEDLEKMELGPEPSLFKSRHYCIRFHYLVNGQSGYFHMFRSTGTRFFNNVAVPISGEEETIESLKAICESFKVALSVKSLSVPLFEGKLERRRSKLPFVQGERPGSLGLAPLGAMTRNMSEGQLMAFVSVGSRALSNVTSQFARLNPMRSVRGLAKRPAAALGALTEGSFQVDSSSDSEEDSARWLRQPLPATERTLSSDYSSDSDVPEPGHDALLESCGILATSPGLANCEQRPPAHQAVDIDDFVLDAMRRASLRQPKIHTIRRRLREAALRSRIAARKPHLTCANKTARLKFAVDHHSWRVEDWKYVIFSDESTFSSRWDQQKRAWRMENTRFCPQNIKEVAAIGNTLLTELHDGSQRRLDKKEDRVKSRKMTSTTIINLLVSGESPVEAPTGGRLRQLSKSSEELESRPASTSPGNLSRLFVLEEGPREPAKMKMSHSESAIQDFSLPGPSPVSSPIVIKKDLVLSPLSRIAKGVQTLGLNLRPTAIVGRRAQMPVESEALQQRKRACRSQIIEL